MCHMKLHQEQPEPCAVDIDFGQPKNCLTSKQMLESSVKNFALLLPAGVAQPGAGKSLSAWLLGLLPGNAEHAHLRRGLLKNPLSHQTSWSRPGCSTILQELTLVQPKRLLNLAFASPDSDHQELRVLGNRQSEYCSLLHLSAYGACMAVAAASTQARADRSKSCLRQLRAPRSSFAACN